MSKELDRDALSSAIKDHLLNIEDLSKVENVFINVYFDDSKHQSYNIKSQVDTYQERLDKILSKFEEYDPDENLLLYVHPEMSILYNGNMKMFSLDYSVYMFTLDTVESIMEDLEKSNG